jgi:signal peptidase I
MKRRLAVLGAALVMLFVLVSIFQPARVQGGGMAPTLADGDRMLVNNQAYRWRDPQRGDVVRLFYPANADKTFVMRVIAEEGDRVQIVGGRVSVNDVPAKDDYVLAEFRSHDDWGPQIVPEGYYFVMGDHRNHVADSRHWGFVPKKYITGRILLRWWPLSSARVF